MRVHRPVRALAAAAATVLVTATACTPDGTAPPTETASPDGPSQITLAVYGPDPVIAAYTSMAASFSAAHPTVAVNLRPYATRAQALADLQKTKGRPGAPDVFLADQADLPTLLSDKLNRPVGDMMVDRNVDIGDGYERVAIEAFSERNDLQCMPIEVSPLVVYYNPKLISLSTLREAGERPPNVDAGWRMDDFAAAAEQASSATTRGVYVAPTVQQLAPFLFSAGSQVVDDPDDPTRLELSDQPGTDAMEQLLPIVRNPAWTFTPQQLAQRSAVSRFKAGQLGMLIGDRSLTPQLRQQEGLTFAVMPMPRVKSAATVADIRGLCAARSTGSSSSAAAKRESKAVGDLIAFLAGDQPSRTLAATGYVVPANSTALHSDEFDQDTQDPVGGSTVFPGAIRDVQTLPRSTAFDQVVAAVNPLLLRLFEDRVIDPLEDRLLAIDAVSQRLLSPKEAADDPVIPSESASPSGTPTPSGSATPGG